MNAYDILVLFLYPIFFSFTGLNYPYIYNLKNLNKNQTYV